MRTNFIGTVLVIILGVNLGAWTLSVATKPGTMLAPISVPVGAQAIDAQSQAAGAAATQVLPSPAAITMNTTMVATTTMTATASNPTVSTTTAHVEMATSTRPDGLTTKASKSNTDQVKPTLVR